MAVPAILTVACGSDGNDAVSQDEVEETTAAELEEVVGVAPESVDCPGDLEAEEDATMRCEITASDGSTIGVTLTVTTVDGDNVEWDTQVDDEISEGPSEG